MTPAAPALPLANTAPSPHPPPAPRPVVPTTPYPPLFCKSNICVTTSPGVSPLFTLPLTPFLLTFIVPVDIPAAVPVVVMVPPVPAVVVPVVPPPPPVPPPAVILNIWVLDELKH